jgi:hypothetical protein
MAKKPTSPSNAAGKKKAAAAPKAVTRTSGVRNSPVPKKVKPRAAAAAPAALAQAVEITHDMIARRAYEISQSPNCGSELDNWLRAERELRG